MRASDSLLSRLNEINDRALVLAYAGFTDEAESLLSDCIKFSFQHLHFPPAEDVPETQPFLIELSLHEAILPDDFIADQDSGVRLYSCFLAARDHQIRNVRTMVSIVAYNLAVMYHETGLLDMERHALCRARTAYKLAATCLSPVLQRGASDESTTCMNLAILNNLGHVSAVLGNVETEGACRGIMQNRLASLDPTSWTWFRYSVSRTRTPSTATHLAPAA